MCINYSPLSTITSSNTGISMCQKMRRMGGKTHSGLTTLNLLSNVSRPRITRAPILSEVEELEVVVDSVRMWEIMRDVQNIHIIIILIIRKNNPLTAVVLTGRTMSMVIPICGCTRMIVVTTKDMWAMVPIVMGKCMVATSRISWSGNL